MTKALAPKWALPVIARLRTEGDELAGTADSAMIADLLQRTHATWGLLPTDAARAAALRVVCVVNAGPPLQPPHAPKGGVGAFATDLEKAGKHIAKAADIVQRVLDRAPEAGPIITGIGREDMTLLRNLALLEAFGRRLKRHHELARGLPSPVRTHRALLGALLDAAIEQATGARCEELVSAIVEAWLPPERVRKYSPRAVKERRSRTSKSPRIPQKRKI
jgi:hypothetical protein